MRKGTEAGSFIRKRAGRRKAGISGFEVVFEELRFRPSVLGSIPFT
jgi:hypothetical protein